MALQDIPYLTATWTAPASDLTDYVGYFDLANAPQSWWDEVDTSDGNKMRVAKDDAAEGATTATELAFQVVNFDNVAQTGELHFKWSGTLPATSPDDVRIYPAKASATSYGATDTFGRNAVWTNYLAVLHLSEDPSGTAPQFVDATGGGHDGTAVNMTSANQVAGKVGNAIQFNGTDTEITLSTLVDVPLTGYSVQVWWNSNIDRADVMGNSGADDSRIRTLYDLGRWDFFHGSDGEFISAGALQNTWYKETIVLNSGTAPEIEVYENGSSIYTDPMAGTTNFSFDNIGGNIDRGNFDGEIDEIRVPTFLVSSDWEALEYSNQNNVGTFWSSITLDNTGGGNVELIPNELSHTHSLQQSSIPITLSGNDLSHSHSLDPSSVQVTLLANDLSHTHSLDSSGIDITLLIDGLQHGHNLEAGSITIVLSPDQLQHSHSLDQSLIQTIELSPTDLAHSHTLQAGSIIIQGDATKVSILANELYQVQLSSAKIYKIALKTEELYNVTVTANEIID